MGVEDLSVASLKELATRLRPKGKEANAFLGWSIAKAIEVPRVALTEIARRALDTGLSAEEIVLCLEACEEMRAVQQTSGGVPQNARGRTDAQRAADRLRTQFRREECDAQTWAVLSAAVFRRDGYRCRYCGDEEGPFEADHILPLSRGGRSTMPNLACACRPCNSAKAGRTPEEWLS